jgi:hypothetical protein
MCSWKPEFLVGGSWSSNAQRFATKEEAEGTARARMMVWTQPIDYRATETEDRINCKRTEAGDEFRHPMNLEELEAFLRWLSAYGLDYHLDDDPAEIIWGTKPTAEQLAHVIETHGKMWDSFTSDQIWNTAGRFWSMDSETRVVATLDTKHWSFIAMAETEIKARDAMHVGWQKHQKATGATGDFAEFEDGIRYTEIQDGQCARDGDIL